MLQVYVTCRLFDLESAYGILVQLPITLFIIYCIMITSLILVMLQADLISDTCIHVIRAYHDPTIHFKGKRLSLHAILMHCHLLSCSLLFCYKVFIFTILQYV